MTSTEDLSGFEARLLAELREVVEAREGDMPQPPRASHRVPRGVALVAAAAVVAVLAVVVPAVVDGDRFTQPAFAVRTLPDGSVEVVVAEHFDDPARLQQELADRGIAVEISEVAGTPGTVGTLTHVFLPEDAPGVEVRRSSPGHVWEFVIDPHRFTGVIGLEIARAGRPGEHLYARDDAFTDGEPLEGLPCTLGWPIASEDLADAAQHAGLAVNWISLTKVNADGWSGKDAAQRPDGLVFSAHLETMETLQVTVLPPDIQPQGRPAQEWQNAGAGYNSQCTPEATQRWR